MKPAAILSELEREPIIFWGCTKTEIFRALRKGLLIGAATATVVTVAGAILLRPSTLVALWMLSMMGTAYVYVRRRLYRIASLRAGRPLFYELHAMIYQSSRFIQPATRYQSAGAQCQPRTGSAAQATPQNPFQRSRRRYDSGARRFCHSAGHVRCPARPQPATL